VKISVCIIDFLYNYLFNYHLMFRHRLLEKFNPKSGFGFRSENVLLKLTNLLHYLT